MSRPDQFQMACTPLRIKIKLIKRPTPDEKTNKTRSLLSDFASDLVSDFVFDLTTGFAMD